MTYAETTKVPVERSQTEVQKLLTALGAQRMAIYHQPEGVTVVFELGETYYRISAPPPHPVRDTQAARAQAERAAWRALVLLVKAKKVAIDQKITTVEREFMADTVMPDGSVLIDHHRAIVAHNYREGGVPRLGFDG
ncbi:hypothetical protein [Hyphomonas sp. UBA4494]|jgi:hypothetical protein|uniref:hypothetical protein n=1 Tax=Hyphomonas sp. UBA4494 TaxID=1946631 RepID=UPI0025C14ECF|nr:hypothetical protein [Hyphomonas sp. UBA4494]